MQTTLKITSVDEVDNGFFSSVMMIPSQEKDRECISNIILILNFKGLEKFQIHQAKVYISTSIKPFTLPLRSVPCHL